MQARSVYDRGDGSVSFGEFLEEGSVNAGNLNAEGMLELQNYQPLAAYSILE